MPPKTRCRGPRFGGALPPSRHPTMWCHTHVDSLACPVPLCVLQDRVVVSSRNQGDREPAAPPPALVDVYGSTRLAEPRTRASERVARSDQHRRRRDAGVLTEDGMSSLDQDQEQDQNRDQAPRDWPVASYGAASPCDGTADTTSPAHVHAAGSSSGAPDAARRRHTVEPVATLGAPIPGRAVRLCERWSQNPTDGLWPADVDPFCPPCLRLP